MWEISDIEDANPRVLPHLRSIGAAHDAFLCQGAHEIETRDHPHVAVFFQLPYPLQIEEGWLTLRTLELGVSANVKLATMTVSISETGRIVAAPVQRSDAGSMGQPTITQLMALVPLWGSRARFYERYAACYDGTDLKETIVTSPQDNWIVGQHLTAMTSSVYEANVARKMLGEMKVMLRRLLPAYSLATLREAPQPSILPNFFVMTLPGRLVLFRPPVPTLSQLLKQGPAEPIMAASASRIANLTTGRPRELSRFEQQLLAMDRLASEGEPKLALVGVLSLVEWFSATHCSYDRTRVTQEQPSLSWLLRKTDALAFLAVEDRARLNTAIAERDRFVHGAPPKRESVTDGVAQSPGREDYAEREAVDVRALIDTAFRIFREVNSRKASTKEPGA